jgi:NAD(P)-dependent dehydrogenase (short-subunit alcohol dehydrogenase family)
VDLQLQGKKAVISGGSRGIGKAVARALAREGCDVAICARNEGPLRESAAQLAAETGRKIVPIVCDTLHAAQIQAFVKGAAEALGGIDILVNNAARVGGTPGTIETVSDADVLRDFEEKVLGYLRMAQAAVPYMKQAGWGRIVNISGGAGRAPGMNISGGVRNIGVASMTRSMANGLGAYGINVNCVYPGLTYTEITQQRYEEQAQREGKTAAQVAKEADERTLIKHVVTMDDIANVVAFLCSPLAIGITGEVITANGGSSAEVHN